MLRGLRLIRILREVYVRLITREVAWAYRIVIRSRLP